MNGGVTSREVPSREVPSREVPSRGGVTRDEGSALIMAIVFITVIGMVIAGALSYSSVSLTAVSRAYAPARDRLYAADAAMKATVAYVMTHPSEGRSLSGGGCQPGRTYGTVRDAALTVQVCPQEGANSLMPTGGGNGWGLVTLATGAERGLDITGSAGLQVNGNVLSNSSIAVDKGSLVVNGGVVQALGGCSGSVVVDGVAVPDCTVATAPGVDPRYVTGLAAAPAAASGSCNSSSKIATLGPGTWTSSMFTAALGSCNYIWLQPGIHYLENITWTIKNKVIAGTLPPTGTAGMATSAIGAGCVQGTNGATLILGGTTTIALSGNTPSLEVCGKAITQTSGASVELPMYGPTADIYTPSNGTLSTITAPTGTSWTNVANAKAIDGTVATYNLAKNGTASVMTLSGFNGTAIPSTLRSLTAAVNGVAAQTATISALTVRNNGESTTACTASSVPTLPIGTVVSASTTTTLTLTCTKALVAPLKLLLTVKAANSGTNRIVSIDGIALSFTDNGGVIKAQSGCVVAVAGCSVLSTGGNGNTIWLDGEVYLPKAMVSLNVPNASTAFSTLGVVVRVLSVKTTGSTSGVPIVAAQNGALTAGDVTVVTKIGDAVWMSCRVTYGVSGSSITSSKVQGCTVPG